MRFKVTYGEYPDIKTARIPADMINAVRVDCSETDRWGLVFEDQHGNRYHSTQTVKTDTQARQIANTLAFLLGIDILPETED